MFAQAKQLALLSSLTLLAVASPFPQALSQCNTGSMQCCNSVQNSTTQGVASLAGLLGINLAGLNIPIGFTCSGISLLSLFGGNGCSANPVCCSDVQFGGLISLGCSPLNL